MQNEKKGIALKLSIASMILGIALQVFAQEQLTEYKDSDNPGIRSESKQILQLADFESSNLPVIVINTDGVGIPDEPKIDAHMGIVYNGPGNRNYVTGPFNHYDGHIGIELRGNTTQTMPKKPYSIETRDALGENLNVPLLGLPEENDWMLRAAYIDKTFIRDPLALWMARALGNYASRTVHVELILNGVYQGIYILAEKIKPDRNRVNITKMAAEDISGDEVTGGYIYEVAKGWVPTDESLSRSVGDNRRIKYPKPDIITDEQRAYIAKYDDDFRALMEQSDYADSVTGYSAWIDVESFIDEILIQEATRNSDAYGWSSHFHKDRMGKLHAGPAWDFDQALANSTFMNGDNYEDWLIDQTSSEIWSWGGPYPQFWLRLFNEPSFKSQLIARWLEMRKGAWSTVSLINVVDSLASYLDEAQVRNFERWPILGVQVWRSVYGYSQRDTYVKEVDYLKSYIVNRVRWIDAQLQENPITSYILHKNYPNPFNQITTIEFSLPKTDYVTVKIYDILGKKVVTLVSEELFAGTHRYTWNAVGFASGIYFCRLETVKFNQSRKLVLLK